MSLTDSKASRALEYLAVRGFYTNAYNDIVRPDRIFAITDYFRRYWVPLLKPGPAWLVVALRQHCYWNVQREWCIVGRQALAEECGLAVRSVDNYLGLPLVDWFVAGRQARYTQPAAGQGARRRDWTRYTLRLDEPLTPAHQAALGRLAAALAAAAPPGPPAARALHVAQALLDMEAQHLWTQLDAPAQPETETTKDVGGLPAGKPRSIQDIILSAAALPLSGESPISNLQPPTSNLQTPNSNLQQACDALYQRIVRPDKITIASQYLRTRWLPLLGAARAWLVLHLRARCYLNARQLEVRDTCAVGGLAELAAVLGVSISTVKLCLAEPPADQFLSHVATHRPGGGAVEMVFRVEMIDPLVPADRAAYEALLAAEADLGTARSLQDAGPASAWAAQDAGLATPPAPQDAGLATPPAPQDAGLAPAVPPPGAGPQQPDFAASPTRAAPPQQPDFAVSLSDQQPGFAGISGQQPESAPRAAQQPISAVSASEQQPEFAGIRAGTKSQDLQNNKIPNSYSDTDSTQAKVLIRHDDDALPLAAAAGSLELLLAGLGIAEPTYSRLIGLEPEPAAVVAWALEALSQERIANKPGFVVAMLAAGLTPPPDLLALAGLPLGRWRALARAVQHAQVAGLAALPEAEDPLFGVLYARLGHLPLRDWPIRWPPAVAPAPDGAAANSPGAAANSPNTVGDSPAPDGPPWAAVLEQLRWRLAAPVFEAHVRHTRLLAAEGGRWTVGVPGARALDWLNGPLRPAVQRVAEQVAGKAVQLEFVEG